MLIDQMLKVIGRQTPIFASDIERREEDISAVVSHAKFLVIGGAGCIGQAVTKELFKRNPKLLHVVDISENNLVELVRDLRSSYGYISGDFRTFAIDCGSLYFERLVEQVGGYDYVLNLSALKHVRSEKDPFTLLRMLETNIFNPINNLKTLKKYELKKYFCVSTDKAANPVNLMGASKRVMEIFLNYYSDDVDVSMARFANVAFSDGSLLHGFKQRLDKMQPITAPVDTLRYFITPQEAGELCLLSCLFGQHGDIFFPQSTDELQLTGFVNIAREFLKQNGYKTFECASEEQARTEGKKMIQEGRWPCYFFKSDTTGEKAYEEFYTDEEILDLGRFSSVGIVKSNNVSDEGTLVKFIEAVEDLKNKREIRKEDIVKCIQEIVPSLTHVEKDKNLDNKM